MELWIDKMIEDRCSSPGGQTAVTPTTHPNTNTNIYSQTDTKPEEATAAAGLLLNTDPV